MTYLKGSLVADGPSSMPIAIIGIGLRFPGDGSDPERFWQMLLDARSARSEVPKTRYNVDGFYHPDPDRLGITSMTNSPLGRNMET
jgi:acyl transferase domain-containing protein